MDNISEFTKYFLNNKDIWFNPQNKYDDFIKENFGDLINNCKKHGLSFKDCNTEHLFNIILIFDQLPYYLYRNNLAKIREYQQCSKHLSNYLIDNNKLNNYNDLQKVFILLALRHGDDINNIYKVINIVRDIRKTNNSNIFKRFYRASLLKLIEINNMKYFKKNNFKNNFTNNFEKNIIDTKSTFTEFSNIIKIQNEEYLDKLKDKVKCYENICVSLSGGVDSMVLLYLLSNLNTVKTSAIHINYKNRDTSDDEMNMCISFVIFKYTYLC